MQIGACVKGSRSWVQCYHAALEIAWKYPHGITRKTKWGYEVYTHNTFVKIP